MRPYVITGGPGIGKTTTIELLASRGYTVIHESARVIIEEEMLRGSDIVPWKNLRAFQEVVVERQLKLEDALPKQKLIFLDRGIIDSYGYSKAGNVAPPPIIEEKGPGRYEKIFILEKLADYKKDAIRFEENEHAERIHNAIQEAYVHFGYEPVHVPVLPPEERVDFILNNIK